LEVIMAIAENVATVRQLWPLLAVTDIERSVAFYRDELGFSVAGEAESNGKLFWCRVVRGGASLMLQQADEEDGPPAQWGRGVAFYFVCDEVDALERELARAGVAHEPVSVAEYGMKQLFVREPDGYLVCFESPTEHWSQ
jgi:glyoxylase I family protein